MHSKTTRLVLRSAGLGAFAVIAAAPWAGVIIEKAQPQRKTTDPPVAAKGKLGQDLFLAIDRRDLPGVQALLKKGADPNARNGLEFAPLYIASASHQPDVMKALLAAGAKPDMESSYGTPLTFAAISGHTTGVKMLIEKGADVNTSRVDAITVLMMAAQSGNPETVAELLKHKAKVNETDLTDASALTYAAREGFVAIGQMLLKAGAKVDNLDVYRQTPLMAAAMNGRPEFVKLLLDAGAKVNARDGKGQTALILAAAYGDYPEVVKTLLGAGANASLTDSKGRTAAALASARGYSETATLLGKAVAVPAKSPEAAVKVSLKLLEGSMKEFSRKVACISCHQEGLGRMVTASARSRGLSIDENLNKAQLARIRGALGFMRPLHLQALKSDEAMKQVPLIEINEVTPGDSWLLAGMAAQNDQATEATAAMAQVLARQQAPGGLWTFSLPRVPMQSSPFTFTALAVRSLQAYAPKAAASETADRVAKAKSWLLSAAAKSSDDLSFRLLGLKWSGASMDERRKAIDELLAAQQPDGGWAQVPDMRSDAYATGQALYALTVAGGVPTSDAVYKRGVEYLVRTQDDDGSWFVNKRAIPANNYFDAGFPHGESQYASFNGTCWATMALLEAMERK